MALSFQEVKTIIPGVGERAYIWCQYQMQSGLCVPNPLNTSLQCTYLMGVGAGNNDTWALGHPMHGVFPQVGDWVSIKIIPDVNPMVSYIQCLKLLEIIDEATFNAGTCLACNNNGYDGNCTHAMPGCFYNNSIQLAPPGIPQSHYNMLGNSYTTWITNSCNDCTLHIPPVPINFLQNCCNPSEQYQFSTTSSIYTQLTTQPTVAVGGEAIRADLYIGGAQTGMKCWSVGYHLNPQLVPFAYGITIGGPWYGLWTSCYHLEVHLYNDPNTPDCCPPTPDGCDSNIMTYLQDKVTDFRTIKDNILNP